MIVLYIVYAIIGISIIIFLHELGHFLAAKRVGVRVERFSLGFDPPVRGKNLRLLSFRKGETEYVLGMIPFGGYVKLAGGEYLADPEHEPRPDELPSKGVGARALVFAAGSLMNIASSFVFFMAAFALGVTFYAPKIGMVDPETPAWEGGLRPGDTVVAVDGKEVIDFTEMRLAVVLGSASQPISVQVERPTGEGGKTRVDLTVTPRFDPELGFNEIGAAPAYDEAIEEVVKGSAAEKAGLRTGDRIRGVEIAGVRLPAMPVSLIYRAYSVFLSLRPSEPIRFFVERDGAEMAISAAAEKENKPPQPQLGVLPGPGNIVRGIQPGSGAAAVLAAGDRVVSVDGERLPAASWLSILEKHARKSEVELGIEPKTGPSRKARVRLDDLIRWMLAEEIAWGDFSSEVISVTGDSPLAGAGLQPGDVLVAMNGKPAYSHEEIDAQSLGSTVEIGVLRAGSTISLTVDRTAVIDWKGVKWRSMPMVAEVFRGGPAERGGIRPGDRILRLDKTDVATWPAMTEYIRAQPAGKEVTIAWRTPEGEVKEGRTAIGSESWSLGLLLAVEEKVVRTGIADSVAMGAKRTAVSAKQIFLTLKSLIRRDVSAKNLSGPVGITHLLTKVVEQGNLGTLIFYLALISINLGLFNLLPFPILDGGHLLFLLIEKLKGSPVDIRVQEMAMNIAFVCILFLAVFVTFNDLKRIF